MLLWVMDVRFENTRTVSGNLNDSRVMSRLHQWDSNKLSFLLVIAEHSVMVLIIGYRPRRPQYDTHW